MNNVLRFRQIHLDFHTSGLIPGIGEAFDKQKWQKMLQLGHVNSINCFAKCHHGWSYFPTNIGKMHPNLNFNLLRAQMDACKEMGIQVPIYLSAGFDNLASYEHPEWREVGPNGHYNGRVTNVLLPGFHKMCFNSPYLEYLCEQIRETIHLFPDNDGIWLDIIAQGQCCCKWCLEFMERNGLDATIESDRIKCAYLTIQKYYEATTLTIRSINSTAHIFQNSGHILRGNRDFLKYVSHIEIESLPTGGWGYDHFPLSAKYCKNLGQEIVGMTGKFHTTWAEFGGYKHPNALRYECAAMLAYGTKCCIGDQLHPDGSLDQSTYRLIGRAYEEVEVKEPWCRDVESIADIGLFSSAASGLEAAAIAMPEAYRENCADTGACRVLLDGHMLFDVLDTQMNFEKYKLIIVPDDVLINDVLKQKIDTYLAKGGKLFLTGVSGIDVVRRKFLFDVGADYEGPNEFDPDYVLPKISLQPSFVASPLVMYRKSQKIRVTTGESLGAVYNTYFNRTFKHFSSHQHTPPLPTPSGFDCGVYKGNILYLAHPVFTIYRGVGAVVYKDYVLNAIKLLLGDSLTFVSNLPAGARVTLMKQEKESRYILHLLYVPRTIQGGNLSLPDGSHQAETNEIEVIEDLVPLCNLDVSLKLAKVIRRITLEPEGKSVPFKVEDGNISFGLDSFVCHQMVVLHY